jgi:hypothetical protein
MTTNICESECPICMEIIDLCKNCATTECGHKFHSNCLMKSIAFNGFGCPYCRFEMVEEIVDSEDEEGDDNDNNNDDDDDDYDDDDEDDDNDDEDEEYENNDDENDNEVLPSFELIQKKFIEQGITYESLVKTIMFNSLIYHKNENIADYQKCNTFVEELFFDIVSKYEPEQEEAVKQANKEFNFYFLQDEYSQRKYQRNMETSLEKFLDLYVDDVSNDSFLLDATTDYLNNRFMEVI